MESVRGLRPAGNGYQMSSLLRDTQRRGGKPLSGKKTRSSETNNAHARTTRRCQHGRRIHLDADVFIPTGVPATDETGRGTCRGEVLPAKAVASLAPEQQPDDLKAAVAEVIAQQISDKGRDRHRGSGNEGTPESPRRRLPPG